MNINKIKRLKEHPELWARFLKYLDCPSEDYLELSIQKAKWLKNTIVFLDMDDTLCTFRYGPKGEFQDEEVAKVGFFTGLEPKANLWIYEILHELGIKFYILSKCFASAHCKAEKHEWLAKNLPFIKKKNVFLLDYEISKVEFVTKRFGNLTNKILIDDYKCNLIPWMEAGGIAIKFGKIYKIRPYPSIMSHLSALDIILGTYKPKQ